MKKITLLLILMLVLPVLPVSQAGGKPSIKITEVYYNTGPGCEFITLQNKGRRKNFEDITLTDGENEINFENIILNKSEKLVISKNDGYEDVWHENPDMTWSNGELDGKLSLPDGNGKVILKNSGEVIDSFYYGDIDEGKKWDGEATEKLPEGVYAKRKDIDTNSKEDWNWTREWKVGHSEFESKTFHYEGRAVAFTSPDSSYDSIMSFLEKVDHSLNISIYKLTDLRIAKKIAELSGRGVEVRVLAEGEPVNGIPKKAKYALSLIEDSGGKVRLMGKGEYAPYDYIHSKYMIGDNESLFLATENIVRSAYSPSESFGNRGWGTVLESERIAYYYQRVFEQDWRFGNDFESTVKPIDREKYKEGPYFSRLNRSVITDEFEITPVLSPDTSTSEKTILDMIEKAQNSIYVQQYYIRHWEKGKNPYLKAIKRAAERGVETKVLLDSSYYNIEGDKNGNDEIRDELNKFAEKNDLDLEARLLSNYKGLIKSHAKGMIVDEKKVLISSINWNANSILQNRETGVIIENRKIGKYFSEVFLRDWRDDIEPIADAGRNRTIGVGESISLTARNSWDDHKLAEYSWDIDGDGDFERKGERLTVAIDKKTTQKIILKVKDVGGNIDKDSTSLSVRNKGEGLNLGRIAGWVIIASPAIIITLFLINAVFISRS